ncbi:MAG: hypothetical protein ACM30E_00430 [Nitrososphaerales archaeon]
MFRRYEHKSQPLLPLDLFLRRLARHVLVALTFMAVALAIGIIGYHTTEGFGFVDSLLNASMILGGMGPVDPLRTPAGKIFASFYALFSGVVFLGIAGIIVAPIAHRLLHRLHLESGADARD